LRPIVVELVTINGVMKVNRDEEAAASSVTWSSEAVKGNWLFYLDPEVAFRGAGLQFDTEYPACRHGRFKLL
jgi:hypothetical protein